MSHSQDDLNSPSIRALMTDTVLAVFRRPTKYIPTSLHVKNTGRELQVFEVLSAYLMSLVESDFEWTVTPLQHDGGVDFYGEKRLFPLRAFEDCKVVIAGQCKATKKVRTPLTNDLWKLLDAVQPSVVCVFLLAPVSTGSIENAERIFLEQTHRPCRILDLSNILHLINVHREQVLTFIQHSLSSNDQRILRDIVLQLPPPSAAPIEVKIHLPERVLAGTPFEVRVSVDSVLLRRDKPIRVTWNRSPDLTLIKPIAFDMEGGFRIPTAECFSSQFTIKIASFHVGDVPLGELVFDVDGIVVKTITIGSVTTVDQYRPVFFWEPYQVQRARYLEILDQAETRSPQAVAVTGQGGMGKTRFCQELGFLSEQRGGEFISVSHPQTLGQPYHIFGLLLQELLRDELDPVDLQQSVESYLCGLHSGLGTSARGTIATIFSGENQRDSVFDREAMLQILLIVLLRKARNITYVLHFSDLQWASTETLDVLGDVLQRLQRVAAEYRTSVLMVFEGRVQTHVEVTVRETPADRGVSTAIFETFLHRFRLPRLEVHPFTDAESRAFLTHIFENVQSAHRFIRADLIPHQEILIEEICRYGKGNPFHMIEQIKLLRHEGTIERNPRTGLIYLARRPRSSYRVPASVQDLITLRLQFIETTHPELATLIKAAGLITDRIDRRLFETLHRTLAPTIAAGTIHEVELLSTDNPSYVTFRHENYYQVVSTCALTPTERTRITGVYLQWYRQQGKPSADSLYEQALVREHRPRSSQSEIVGLLKEALRKSEESHQYQLSVPVLEKLLQYSSGEARRSFLSFDQFIYSLTIRSKLAKFSTYTHDWAIGSREHAQILASIDNYLTATANVTPTRRLTLNYWRASSLIQLANSSTDLGKSHDAVRHLTEARRICESYLGTMHAAKKEPEQRWYVLYSRLLNRLGQANWMDGNYRDSLQALKTATKIVEQHVRAANQRRLLHHINLLDYGAVLLHQSPMLAVRAMRKSRLLIPAKGWSPRYGILSSTTLVIGELVQLFLREHTITARCRRFLESRAVPQLQRDFEQAILYGFKQEQVAATLMLGVCLSLLADHSAVQWYMQCIEIAFHSNNLEWLWRAHLNLAQHLTAGRDKDSRLFHCQRAAQLLADDLQRRSPAEAQWRKRHLARPLARIATILPPTELRMLRDYIPDPAHLSKPNAHNALFRDQIVFIWSGESEYYPYGG